MRICYDYQIFSIQRYGGISRYFVELASRIHQYPGSSVRVIAPFYRSRFLAAISGSIPVQGRYLDILGARRIGYRLDAALSSSLSAIYKPDIVHETYYSRNRTSSAAAKTVVTVHDMIEELFPEYFPMSKKTIETRKAAFRRADHLICISESTRADLLKLYEVDPDKVSVAYHGSSLSASILQPVSVGDPFFLYVGERRFYKNFLGLLAAFAEHLLYKTHKLVCFGGGPLTAMERERMEHLRIPKNRILFLGGDDEQLARYYASAQAFVYPSLYEGFGIPLLEAMECGCPIICSNNSAIPEVAGDAAMYFDAYNTHDISSAMHKIARSPATRLDLIAKGKIRATRFSWDKCAQQTYSIYEKLLTKP